MPSALTSPQITVYHSAADLPDSIWEMFHAHARSANIVFPYAKKARRAVSSRTEGNLWIVCASPQPGSRTSIDFVLSCTEGPLGPYPIFIFTPIPTSQLRPEFFTPRIHRLVCTLKDHVPPERVFSVFALDVVTRTFATFWTKETGISLDRDSEYYWANFTYCTRRTYKPRQHTLLPDIVYDLRPAVERDVQQAAELCYGFAAASEPFTLTQDEAIEEATRLIRDGQLWVHEITARGQAPELASIVAVTRTSETVAGITKVYTNPKWRQRGCAERLTRFVCKQLLQSKESVVLYVAHNNPAAAKVYDRVGFVGLSSRNGPIEGVDSWLELGFDRHLVELGHW